MAFNLADTKDPYHAKLSNFFKGEYLTNIRQLVEPAYHKPGTIAQFLGFAAPTSPIDDQVSFLLKTAANRYVQPNETRTLVKTEVLKTDDGVILKIEGKYNPEQNYTLKQRPWFESESGTMDNGFSTNETISEALRVTFGDNAQMTRSVSKEAWVAADTRGYVKDLQWTIKGSAESIIDAISKSPLLGMFMKDEVVVTVESSLVHQNKTGIREGELQKPVEQAVASDEAGKSTAHQDSLKQRSELAAGRGGR